MHIATLETKLKPIQFVYFSDVDVGRNADLTYTIESYNSTQPLFFVEQETGELYPNYCKNVKSSLHDYVVFSIGEFDLKF